MILVRILDACGGCVWVGDNAEHYTPFTLQLVYLRNKLLLNQFLKSKI